MSIPRVGGTLGNEARIKARRPPVTRTHTLTTRFTAIVCFPASTYLSNQRMSILILQMAYRVAVLHERPPLDVILPERQPPKMIRVITSCW